jgi:hypothetical protein
MFYYTGPSELELTPDNMLATKSSFSTGSGLDGNNYYSVIGASHPEPETGTPLEHFIIYAATGLAFGLGFKRRMICRQSSPSSSQVPLRLRSCSCRDGIHASATSSLMLPRHVSD